MQALKTINSTFVPLPLENVDTDQIIPARFLKATTKAGFGKNLFRDWRYEGDDEARPKPDFVSWLQAKTLAADHPASTLPGLLPIMVSK
jgi:3-isopropylmalate dehydratase small subunit